MLKITHCVNITDVIEDYFNINLFDIKHYDMNHKQLFILTKDTINVLVVNDIAGSFILDTKNNLIESLYIIESERGKGYCLEVIRYLKTNYKKLYLDAFHNNLIANKCYSKYLKYVGIISHNLFKKIYKYSPNKNVKILRYEL